MKQLLTASLLLSSLLLVTSCTSGKSQTSIDGDSTKKSGELISATTSDEDSNPVFKGKLKVDPVIDEDTVVLSFDAVQVVNDPESIHDILNSNGVVLNISKDMFDKDIGNKEVTEGSEIEFELDKQPALTYSIPPQIPGNSIISVKLIEK